MENTKVTKRVVLEAVKAAAENGVDFGSVSAADVIAYAETTIAQLDAKAAKAKEKAAEKKAAEKKADGDALRAAVESVLTEDLQMIDEITAKVQAIEGYEDVTKSKVTARLTQLVKSNTIHKEQVKVDSRKVMAYALGEAVEEAE